MEFDYLWLLLLPVFFGLGWLAARIDIRQLLRDSRAVPKAYFEGLNFLLNEQPDRALGALVSVAHHHPDAVELQFALGSLFRKRGELDRAIKLHQSILQRPDLSPDVRSQALQALGEDYQRAGLLDRAEDSYRQLLDNGQATEARMALLNIYQQEREWQKAIDMASQLPDAAHAHQHEVAQFYCELAQRAMSASQWEVAGPYLQSALEVHRKCVRATLLQGDLALMQGQPDAARQAWLRIEQQNPDYLHMVAEKVLRIYQDEGRQDEGLTLLRGLYQRYPSLDLLEPLNLALQQAGKLQDSYELLRDEVRRQPSLLGLDRLLQVQLLVAPPERRADLEQVRNLVHQHADKHNMHSCRHCGFRARQYFWHCPGCAEWESYSALRGQASLP
ncbi:lipopolysaccharide assembly protein LapB [Leeia aquatica]|uniref:Lipopolysaccharide assembly protein B n=1 Tax=Leeia aquatica TaxID=2725557 RepID=A0A847RRW2_9NEIS|nr:lipopolysaccharide assembly protein LapB [Leeia aquatica]NLR73960.1 lipopolysaccharide assembly protein LapB [Leeia aquatica]